MPDAGSAVSRLCWGLELVAAGLQPLLTCRTNCRCGHCPLGLVDKSEGKRQGFSICILCLGTHVFASYGCAKTRLPR